MRALRESGGGVANVHSGATLPSDLIKVRGAVSAGKKG